MAQTLDDQVNTIEKALGERMIEHALIIVRSWMSELGDSNPYEQAYRSIQERYHTLYNAWLSSDDENTDSSLDELTGEAYQLADAVYADIRVKRGASPDMHGFNHENIQSIVNYFANCVKMKQEDFDWLHHVLETPNMSATALMASGALAKNMRECFTIDGFFCLIKGIKSKSQIVADQCLAYVFTLLIQYDIRMDFFPQIQNAFVQTVRDVDAEGANAFEVLCALVRSTHPRWLQAENRDPIVEQLPEDVRSMLSLLNAENDDSEIVSWIPKDEQEYMQGLVGMLPDTWLYNVLVSGNMEREANLAAAFLSVGRMDLCWDHWQFAEDVLRKMIREGSSSPMDYINYAHCMMLKGDRILAYENYRQARSMCQTAKEFFSLFRPDRRPLVDHGVPVEQVYLMEDMLLKI
jgi:tetratricopeptide (TPR) repeat protein